MSITIRVGLWHERLGLGMSADAADDLVALMGTNRLLITLVDRILTVRPGTKDHPRLHKTSTHTPDDFGISLEGSHAESVARFYFHEVEFAEVGQSLMAEIPADHLLPWPKLRQCDLYYTPDEIVRQVMMRRRSALLSGLTRMDPIPDRLLEELDQEHRTLIFQQSKALRDEYLERAAA